MPVWYMGHICAWADVWTCIVDMQENTKAGSISPFDSNIEMGPVFPRTPTQTHAKFSSPLSPSLSLIVSSLQPEGGSS